MTAARIKGFYLALTTIAAQAIFHFLVLNLPSGWLGGAGCTAPRVSPIPAGLTLRLWSAERLPLSVSTPVF